MNVFLRCCPIYRKCWLLLRFENRESMKGTEFLILLPEDNPLVIITNLFYLGRVATFALFPKTPKDMHRQNEPFGSFFYVFYIGFFCFANLATPTRK